MFGFDVWAHIPKQPTVFTPKFQNILCALLGQPL